MEFIATERNITQQERMLKDTIEMGMIAKAITEMAIQNMAMIIEALTEMACM